MVSRIKSMHKIQYLGIFQTTHFMMLIYPIDLINISSMQNGGFSTFGVPFRNFRQCPC